MRSFSRRIAGFTLVRYVYTWAHAVEMAAVLVGRVHIQSYARIWTRRTMALMRVFGPEGPWLKPATRTARPKRIVPPSTYIW